MNKITKAVAVFGAVTVAGVAGAVNPATFDVTVNMAGAFSVAIVSGAPVAFGAVNPSSINSNSAAAVVVQNDSTAFVEDYELSVANSAGGWTIGAAAGVDTGTMHAQFSNNGAPTTGVGGPATDFQADDQLIGGAAAILAGSAGTLGAFADNDGTGLADGQDVATSENNNLYVRFQAPTSDTTSGAAQSFTITINAVAP